MSKASRSEWLKRSTWPTVGVSTTARAQCGACCRTTCFKCWASLLADPPDGSGPDSRRWADVPITIRAGKALPVTATEVTVRFRPAPYNVFGPAAHGLVNALRFRIWPQAETGLRLAGKAPGVKMRSRRRGGSSPRCLVMSGPSPRTATGAADRRKPTRCCLRARRGMTRSAERDPNRYRGHLVRCRYSREPAAVGKRRRIRVANVGNYGLIPLGGCVGLLTEEG